MSSSTLIRSTRLLRVNFASRISQFAVRSSSQLYETHIPTTPIQKTILAVGSSLMALVDPYRDDMVAVSGEVMGYDALIRMREKMSKDDEGSKILAEKPRINSQEINLKKLESLPENSLGYQYVKFLKDNNISCDTRKDVKFVDDPELAYVMQRYRETHDLMHLLLYMPTNMLGEITVKWVEAIQYDLPMCWGAAVLGAYRLKPKQRIKYKKSYLDWAVKAGYQSRYFLNIYYEQRWDQDIDELRKELNIPEPPSKLKKD